MTYQYKGPDLLMLSTVDPFSAAIHGDVLTLYYESCDEASQPSKTTKRYRLVPIEENG